MAQADEKRKKTLKAIIKKIEFLKRKKKLKFPNSKMSRVSATIKRGLTKTDYQCLGTGTRDELRTMCPSLKRDVPQIGTDGQ